MTDLKAIKQRHSMTEVAGRYTVLRKGNGPCPLCGGKDRFYVHRDDANCGCRRCGLKGDVIDLVSAVHRVGLADAVAILGDEACPAPARTCCPAQELKIVQTEAWWRSLGWQDRASEICRQGEWFLDNSRAGRETGKTYLAARGLSPRTWAAFGLGFEPYRSAIVIPWRDRRLISAVKFRLIQPREDGRRFEQHTGGRPVLFGTHLCERSDWCVVLEGEMNAMSVWQVGIDADVVSIGSEANVGPLDMVLRRYKLVLLWLDDRAKLEAALARFSGGNLTGMWSVDGLDANDVLVQRGPECLTVTISDHLEQMPGLRTAA